MIDEYEPKGDDEGQLPFGAVGPSRNELAQLIFRNARCGKMGPFYRTLTQ